jgi:hypothetical protein
MSRFCSDRRIAPRTRRAAPGLRSRMESAIAAISAAARGVNRSFIDRSGERRLRSPHQSRTGGTSLERGLPARRADAPDRWPPALPRHGPRSAWPGQFRPGCRGQPAHRFEGFSRSLVMANHMRCSSWNGRATKPYRESHGRWAAPCTRRRGSCRLCQRSRAFNPFTLAR